MDLASFERLAISKTTQAHRTYWLELLFRAHFAATTSLVRQDRWLRAARDGSSNCLGFAAAFRGLLESAADDWFSLSLVPRYIAEKATLILRILAGLEPTGVWHSWGTVEDRLLHFQFARNNRYTSDLRADPTHRPETAQTYLRTFESESPVSLPILRCYNALCNLTHPAADSLAYSVERTASGEQWQFVARDDGDVLHDMASAYGPVFCWAVQSPVNNAL